MKISITKHYRCANHNGAVDSTIECIAFDIAAEEVSARSVDEVIHQLQLLKEEVVEVGGCKRPVPSFQNTGLSK